jgi:hypothetical protein
MKLLITERTDWRLLLMTCIKRGVKQMRQTTKGWQLLLPWKDGSKHGFP